MSIQLVKQNNGTFSISKEYDENLVKLIRTYEKRYWDAKLKVWTLPMNDYNDFIFNLEDIGFNYELTEQDDINIEFSNNGKDYEISFNTFHDQFPLLRTLNNSYYDRDRKIFYVPIIEKESLQLLLSKSNFKYNIQKLQSRKTLDDQTIQLAPKVNRKRLSVFNSPESEAICRKLNL